MDEQILLSRQKAARFPVKYRGMTLAAWRPYSTSSEAALAAAQDFVASFPQRFVPEAPEGSRDLVGRGLALIGKPGAGKTTLTALVLTELIREHNVDCLFIAYADFMSLLVEQMSVQKMAEKGDAAAQDRFWEIEAVKRRIFTSPVIGLDDVGKEHHTASGFAANVADRLLRNRHRNGLPTVVNSNKPLAEWGDTYGPSMSSFVYEAFTEVPIGGKDLRRRAS